MIIRNIYKASGDRGVRRWSFVTGGSSAFSELRYAGLKQFFAVSRAFIHNVPDSIGWGAVRNR